MKKYAITYLVDNDFADYTMVSLVSFIKNNKWFNGDVIIICHEDTLSTINREKFRKIYHKVIFRETNKIVYEESMEFLKDKIAQNSFPLAMLYKLEVFVLQEYDKVLVLDGDTLIIDNVYELFDNKHDLILTSDSITKFYGEQVTSGNTSIWYGLNNVYCNGGVYCIGKKYLNERDKMLEYIKTNVNFNIEGDFLNMKYFMEQDLINLYFNNKNGCVIYPPIYNLQVRDIKQEQISYCINSKIIHYLGESKPKYYPSLTNKEMLFICSIWFTYENLTNAIVNGRKE